MASIASDVIREIRENPDVREEVRRLILTDELLAMPALLARMDSRQDQMAELLVQQGESLDRMDARQDRMEETQSRIAELLVQQGEHLDRMDARQDRMDARQDRTEGRQDRLEEIQSRTSALLDSIVERLDRHEDHFAELKGSTVELLAQDRLISLLPERLDVRNPVVVRGRLALPGERDRFANHIANAREAGRISEDQRLRLYRTDIIFRARRGSGDAAKTVYAVTEVAYRVDDKDITRVSDSVTALRAMFEEEAEVLGVIYGINIPVDCEDAAEKLGLKVIGDEMPN